MGWGKYGIDRIWIHFESMCLYSLWVDEFFAPGWSIPVSLMGCKATKCLRRQYWWFYHIFQVPSQQALMCVVPSGCPNQQVLMLNCVPLHIISKNNISLGCVDVLCHPMLQFDTIIFQNIQSDQILWMDILYLFLVMTHLLTYSLIPHIKSDSCNDHLKKIPSFCILFKTCFLEDKVFNPYPQMYKWYL